MPVPVDIGVRPEDVAENVFMAFGLHTKLGRIRQNAYGPLMSVGVCTRDYLSKKGRFYPGGTVWLRVLMRPVASTAQSYILEGTVILPRKVVHARPRAETTTKAEVIYAGMWEVEDGHAVLTLYPAFIP
jgi:hypothetical protein